MMNVDQQGFLWLSNPWIVTLTLIVVTGAVVGCHRLLMSEGPARPVPVPVRAATPPGRLSHPHELSGAEVHR